MFPNGLEPKETDIYSPMYGIYRESRPTNVIFIKSICSCLRSIQQDACKFGLSIFQKRGMTCNDPLCFNREKISIMQTLVRTLAYLPGRATLKSGLPYHYPPTGQPEDWSISIKGAICKKHPQQISAGCRWLDTLQISTGPSSLTKLQLSAY
jgi:hypothetical protein